MQKKLQLPHNVAKDGSWVTIEVIHSVHESSLTSVILLCDPNPTDTNDGTSGKYLIETESMRHFSQEWT
jgi:hypothetical protein